ncbi:MAG TPA: 16S rRNA (cytidine(1402)-2'-O)-methyltransferase [Gammaproteobacteria bacterium]|nr:16S rRNA (cytidine(1402)-2'-O)-methyltransferase [Gammaproteobacteria bacterium]
MNTHHFGTLDIVATPLGNLQDMSFRAVSILKDVDRIASEDTRHSLPLLRHFSIQKPLLSLHEHNEKQRSQQLLEYLQKGESIALISDAGTPLISDPGAHLVQTVRYAGITVVPIPGPCAAIAALSAAGLPTDRFVFEGFLPVKGKLRQERLSALKIETRTMIFYEAPHRISELVASLIPVLGEERECVFARELTKIYETIHYSTLTELKKWIKDDIYRERGEIVLLVKGAIKAAEENNADSILKILLKNLPLKQAVELTAEITHQRKNTIYQQALLLKK